MAEPYLSEIKMIAFNFAPKNWALCNGQFLPINQNQALFSLLGTTYGGNGQTTFALPNLRGRVPIHMGGGHTLGETGGEEAHTVTLSEMPAHVHALRAAAQNGDVDLPTGANLASFNNAYRQPTNPVAISSSAIAQAGGSQAHENRQPFLTVNFAIALVGIFPSQN